MTSPDMPSASSLGNNAVTTNTVNSLQSVTQQSIAQAAFQTVADSLNELASAFFNNILGGFGNVVDAIVGAINQFISDLVYALSNVTGGFINLTGLLGSTQNTATTAAATATNAQSTAMSAQTTSTSNAAAIAALQATNISSSSGGNSISEASFPPNLSGSLGTGWFFGGNSAISALWGTSSAGVAGLTQNSSAGSGISGALNTQQMATDQHQVVLVPNNTGDAQALTALVIHSAVDLSALVYANVYPSAVYIGYGGYNSSTQAWTFNDWNSGGTSISLAVGQTLLFGATELGGIYTYNFSINGTSVVSYTDSTGLAPLGSSHRYVGMLSQQYLSGFFAVENSGWLVTGFSAADTVSPTFVGTGSSIYRSATGSISVVGTSTTGWYTMGTGTFDTERVVANMTVSNLGTGVITAQKAGWYTCTMSAEFSGGSAATITTGGVGVTPSGGSLTIARDGYLMESGSTQGLAAGAQGGGTIYLNVGDSVQPVVYSSATTPAIVGNGGGYVTFFDVVLVSGS